MSSFVFCRREKDIQVRDKKYENSSVRSVTAECFFLQNSTYPWLQKRGKPSLDAI